LAQEEVASKGEVIQHPSADVEGDHDDADDADAEDPLRFPSPSSSFSSLSFYLSVSLFQDRSSWYPVVSYFMLLWMERARGWPKSLLNGSVLFGGGMGGGDRSTSRARMTTTRRSGMPLGPLRRDNVDAVRDRQ
jgi:hypothetical protein